MASKAETKRAYSEPLQYDHKDAKLMLGLLAQYGVDTRDVQVHKAAGSLSARKGGRFIALWAGDVLITDKRNSSQAGQQGPNVAVTDVGATAA